MGYYRNVADGIYYREGPVEVLKTFRNPQEIQLNSLIFFVNMSCYIRLFG